MAEQVIQLPRNRYVSGVNQKSWVFPIGSRPLLDTAIGAQPNIAFVQILIGNTGSVGIGLGDQSSADVRRDFADAVENNGIFTLAVDGHSVDFGILGADVTEPYSWTPSNAAEITSFYNAIANPTGTATLTLRDGPIAVAPVFSPDVADAAAWTVGEAITPIVLPYPDNAGGITPTRPVTYAAVGALPAGIRLETYQETVGSGNEQTFQLPSSFWRKPAAAQIAWTKSGSPGFGFVDGVLTSDGLNNQSYLSGVQVTSFGLFNVSLNEMARKDLSDALELSGEAVLTVGLHTIVVPFAGADAMESYHLRTAVSEVRAFYNAIGREEVAATLTLRDYTPYQRNRARLVGTPSAGASGNIVIRATNSAGSDDWTLPYGIRGFYRAQGRVKIMGEARGRMKLVGSKGATGRTKWL